VTSVSFRAALTEPTGSVAPFKCWSQDPIPLGRVALLCYMLIPQKKKIVTENASELYRPNDRRLSAKLVPTFAGRGCQVISATDPYGRILGFLDQSRYFFFQVTSHLYSWAWVDPVPDPLLLR
jgi:hypothetical protein